MTSNSSPSPSRRDNSSTVRQLLRPLAPFLADTAVTEIVVNTPGSAVVYRGPDRTRYVLPDLSAMHLGALTSALATYNGTGLAPVLSLMLPDGERAQIVSPPALLEGHIALNIRRHTQQIYTLEALSAQGIFEDWADMSITRSTQNATPATPSSEEMASLSHDDCKLLDLLQQRRLSDFLSQAVLQRRNIVIAGATGSGKTTFARALIDLVPQDERLITMEDVHELQLPRHTNKVHLLYGDIAGRISATDCIKSCMRMSPDRIFLAEIRGVEAWEYLTALNTGHPGSITTTHANGAREAFSRLALLIKQSEGGRQLDLGTIRHFLYSTIDIVLYFAKYRLKQVWFDPSYAKSLTI